MRAAIYIRVSTEEQKREGYSIESQNEVCMRWIAEKKFDLVDTYVDEGYSAKNLKRPDVKRLMKDLERNHFDILVFWRLNRLTRSVKDKVVLFELIDKNRVGLKSMSEEIDTTTASGRMVTNILISVAQGEREQTGENVHSTMYERAMKGIRQGAVAPYGYRLIEGQLIVQPDEADVVRRVYELYTKPMSDTAIAKLFNNPPVVPRSTGRWSGFAVNYILTNPVYCGKLRWNYRKLEGKRTHKEIIVEATHEPIVSPELFDRIQAIRNRRSITREKVFSTYCFTGVLKCGRCGHGMIGVKQKRMFGDTRFYRCLGRANYGTCDMPHIQEKTVNRIFLEALQLESELFSKLVEVREPEQVDPKHDSQLRELESIKKRRKKWQDAYADDVISLEDLRLRMQEEKVKEDYVMSQLTVAPAKEKSQYSRDELVSILGSFQSIWANIDDELTKKAFIQDIFEDITIDSPLQRGVGGRYTSTPAHIVDWRINN